MARRRRKKEPRAEDYRHPEAKTPMRPDAGAQAQFRKKKAPVTYRYDSSLSLALDWDGQNGGREREAPAPRLMRKRKSRFPGKIQRHPPTSLCPGGMPWILWTGRPEAA